MDKTIGVKVDSPGFRTSKGIDLDLYVVIG